MRFRARYAVVPVIAALALTACARPGTAAMVDGHRITDAAVAGLTLDLTELNGSPSSADVALSSLIIADPILEVTSEAGLGVSDAEGAELLDGILASSGRESWDYSTQLITVARVTLAMDKLNGSPDGYEIAAAAAEAIAAQDVTVNPRYGEWNPAGAVEPAALPWLVTPGGSAVVTLD